MPSHQQIDERSLALAKVVATKIDADPGKLAIDRARTRCARWRLTAPCDDVNLWAELLLKPWPEIRTVLLDTSERGTRLRQSSPFCDVISPRERWDLYRSFQNDARTA